MTKRKTYRANVEHDGSTWMVRVPEIDRVTQARRLDQVGTMARSLIRIMTGEPEDSFELLVSSPELPEDLMFMVLNTKLARERAAEAAEVASNLVRLAARGLTNAGLTIRDAGALLGVSHQRVAQLLATPGTPEVDHPEAAEPDEVAEIKTLTRAL